MDINQLNVIINEIGSNLNCKKCGNKIDISEIKIISHSEASAEFSAHCKHCSNNMQISAELSKNNPIQENQIQKNGEKKIEKKNELVFDIKETIITKEEVSMVSKILLNSNNLSDLIK